MNFLAHALLAGDDPALAVGGIVGDWIKGPLPAGLPPDLARVDGTGSAGRRIATRCASRYER